MSITTGHSDLSASLPPGPLRWWRQCLAVSRQVAVAWLLLAPTVLAQSGFRGSDPGGSIFGRDEQPEEVAAGPSISATDELVAAIRIEGTKTIPQNRVLSQLQTRIGRPYDPQLVQRDVKKLYALPWFVNVETYTEPSSDGRIVIFKVTERPTIRYVDYLGNNKIRDKKLAKETGLKVGGAISPYAIEEARTRIEQLYAESGFNRVQVSVIEGNDAGDRGVVFHINEGNPQKIWNVHFEGNTFASDGQLKTKIKSKPGFARIFKGYVDYEQIDADVLRLTDYYRRFGFFQAKVSRELEWNEKGTWATIRFIVYEGRQSQVRNVSLLGNELFATPDVVAGLQTKGGQSFERDVVNTDVEWLKELYGSRGYVFADVKADVRYLELPGQVDLVYTVSEGKRFRVGRIFVHIGGENPHTKIQTALNRLSIKPGQVMDIREVRASERRLQASSLFHSDPMRNIYPKITFRIPEVDDGFLNAGEPPVVRGQSPPPDPSPIAVSAVPDQPGAYEVRRSPTAGPPGLDMDVHLVIEDDGTIRPQSPPANQTAQMATTQRPPLGWDKSPAPQTASTYQSLPVSSASPYQSPPQRLEYRGQSPDSRTQTIGWTSGNSGAPQPTASQAVASSGYGGQVVQATGPEAAGPGGPSIAPAQYVQEIPPPGLPLIGGPLPPSSAITPFPVTEAIAPGVQGLPAIPDPTVDVFLDLEETQTGRLLLGVGINSDAGVVGQFLIDERNFDWRRPPRSWQDVIDGTAWRGDGQGFRIEAAPGSEVQRYLINFQEPFLMDTPVSLGLSGSYYDRRFTDWDEQRLGGRISLGYQWVQSDVSTNFTYRGESVKISNPSNPNEPQLAEVLGDNALHGFRLGLVNDTRDSSFLATQGHYFEVYGEQVIGTFDYPRGGVDLRKYFLVRERPDHSGRHVLSLTTKVDVSGTDTPLYDNFFAGGFSTLRGFDFRGASPVSDGVIVGGEFRWLNSAEYMFPITADDMLHGVAFCDFGTVTPTPSVDDFRVAPGLGLRVTVPAMGPAPIALDFAWPIARADTDDLQVFSFSIGFLR